MRETNDLDRQIKINGKDVIFKAKITFHQADRKVLKEICGCNGSFCLYCFISKVAASNPDIIRRGFDVEKNIDDIIKMATALASKGQLNSKTSSEKRHGITYFPLETGYLRSNEILPPLHAKINLLNHVLEILYLYNIRHIFPNNRPKTGNKKKDIMTKDEKRQLKNQN